MAQACFFAPVPVTLPPPPPYHGAEGEWTMKKHFAVLGGDQRQRQLSRLLRRDGHQVDTWGMEPDDRPEEALALAAPADCVILPLPVTRDGRRLHAPMCQAGLALESLWPVLSEEERDVALRGRNAHVGHAPKNAAVADYHGATALEALFGYLYLAERGERLRELFAQVIAVLSQNQAL